jgi:hypothetical protein
MEDLRIVTSACAYLRKRGLYSRTVTYIRHQGLESHVLHTGNIFCPLEVLACPIFSPLTRIVYEILGNLAESPTFLAEIDHNTATTFLSFLDSLFYAKDEVWTACADIGSENVTAVAFVVDSEGETDIRVCHLGRVAEDVHSETADRGEEELNVVAGDELRVRSSSFLEQAPTKGPLICRGVSPSTRSVAVRLELLQALTDAEPLSDAW